MPKTAVIIVAAGKGERFNGGKENKAFAKLDGRAMFLRSVEQFANRDDVCQTILVISPQDEDFIKERFGANLGFMGVQRVLGGKRRCDSVANGLAAVREDADLVAIHDAARPCFANEWVSTVFAAAEKSGAAILAIPVAGTLKRVAADHTITETVAREGLWEAQTPQVFRRTLILEAYAKRGGFQATDDAQLVERIGHAVTIVTGSPVNIKITTREDLRLAEKALDALPKPKFQGPAHPFKDDEMWR
jgi:2-C-methyl-D-erythritol 4-phosphate cytidylyltransferase